MITIDNLSFNYNRKKPIYRNLSLTMEKGSIYGLLGTNGSGKTTLLKNMVGLLFPTEGGITVNNFEPCKRQPSFLQSVYFISEQVYVPAMSVSRYVYLNAPFYPNFDEKALHNYLSALEVDSSVKKLTELSFGQQKKFIIAFALACNTPVLLMDEPTNGLDIPSKSQFRKLMASAITDDRLFVISTHQTRDLEQLIDNVIIVDEGSVLLNASMGTIADKLNFAVVKDHMAVGNALYHETSLHGDTVVLPNTEGVDTKVNLEHLFNAVVAQPDRIKQLFTT
jgi:ABC-2 type transport system ATP-binding protein